MEFQSGIPIYQQVISALQEQMITGILKPGDKLPSSRDLALQFQINPNTAARVYSEMEALGLTFTKRGIGTFVTDDPEKLAEMKNAFTAQLIDAFRERMERIGYSASDLPALLETYLQKEHGGTT